MISDVTIPQEMITKAQEAQSQYRQITNAANSSVNHAFTESELLWNFVLNYPTIADQVRAKNNTVAAKNLDQLSSQFPIGKLNTESGKLVSEVLAETKATLQGSIRRYSAAIAKAQQLEVNGKTGESIKEYKEAYDIQPSVELKKKILEISEKTLGL